MITIMKFLRKSLVLLLTFSLLFADASISWAGKSKTSKSKGGAKRAGNTKAGKKSGKTSC